MKNRYVVGYAEKGNRTFYGKIRSDGNAGWFDTMTRRQAERYNSKMPCRGSAIFKLVRVK